MVEQAAIDALHRLYAPEIIGREIEDGTVSELIMIVAIELIKTAISLAGIAAGLIIIWLITRLIHTGTPEIAIAGAFLVNAGRSRRSYGSGQSATGRITKEKGIG